MFYGRDRDSLSSALAAAVDDDDPDQMNAGRALARRHIWHAAAAAHDGFTRRILVDA